VSRHDSLNLRFESSRLIQAIGGLLEVTAGHPSKG
jgi:hypothetical protein